MGRDALTEQQPCEWCGEMVPVNAVSDSECFCSQECYDEYDLSWHYLRSTECITRTSTET